MTPPAWWSRLTANVLMTQRWGPCWRLLDRCCARTHAGARIYGGIYPYDWHGPLPWLAL